MPSFLITTWTRTRKPEDHPIPIRPSLFSVLYYAISHKDMWAVSNSLSLSNCVFFPTSELFALNDYREIFSTADILPHSSTLFITISGLNLLEVISLSLFSPFLCPHPLQIIWKFLYFFALCIAHVYLSMIFGGKLGICLRQVRVYHDCKARAQMLPLR